MLEISLNQHESYWKCDEGIRFIVLFNISRLIKYKLVFFNIKNTFCQQEGPFLSEREFGGARRRNSGCVNAQV